VTELHRLVSRSSVPYTTSDSFPMWAMFYLPD
jgi:hypothetical protein